LTVAVATATAAAMAAIGPGKWDDVGEVGDINDEDVVAAVVDP
jgi:hypothetical protein